MKASIKQLYRQPQAYTGRQIDLAGWVRTVRDSKTFGFIELNDGSFFRNLQVVFEDNKIDNFKDIARLTIGSSIRGFGGAGGNTQRQTAF